MKSHSLFLSLFLFLSGHLSSQNNTPISNKFDSNLGIQEIVEVGSNLNENRSAIVVDPSEEEQEDNASQQRLKISNPIIGTPLGSLKNAPPLSIPQDTPNIAASFNDSNVKKSAEVTDSILPITASIQSGVRVYRSNNVLRQKNSLAENSGVFEMNAGLGAAGPNFKLGEYITMIPKIDLFMQWANYEKRSELLDYRFGMLKGNLKLNFPKDISVNFFTDYNTLHSLDSGDKFFDSIAPGLSLQKIFPITEQSFVILESMLRWSNIDSEQYFEAAGIFPDSGNNYQTSLSLSYIHQFGQTMKWSFMPRIGINRTNYTVTPNIGRLDYLFNGGASLIYQWQEWLGVQLFWTYSSMSSDTIDDFDVIDFGLAISGNYRF
jgi:hypothetical protein